MDFGATTILMCWTIILVVFVLIQKEFQNRARRQFSQSHHCQDPPRHLPLDFIGLLFPVNIGRKFRERSLLTWTRHLFKSYNGTFVSNIIGQDYIFTCHPQNIQQVLAVQFTDFDAAAERSHLFKHLSPHGILASDGQEWKTSREQLRRQFSYHRSVDLRIQERHIQQFISKISDGEFIDAQEMFSNLSVDSLSEFVLGDSINTLSVHQSTKKKEVSDAIRYTKDTIAKKGFAGPFHWIIGVGKFPNACEIIRQYIQRIGDQALETQTDGDVKSLNCLVQSLAKEEKDLSILTDQLSSVFIAGIDTMTSLLSATFWFLARDERVFNLLRTEIRSLCGSSLPTSDQLKSLKYLRCVINETLRLLPPVPYDMRTANKNTTLPYGGGINGKEMIMVKKGQNVVFSSYAAHRWSGIYGQDAHRFRPERWEEIKVSTPGYIPFHVGPRSCPGQQYAMIEASYQIVRILQTFSRLEIKDRDDWEEHISMTLGNHKGVNVAFFRK